MLGQILLKNRKIESNYKSIYCDKSFMGLVKCENVDVVKKNWL